MFNFGKNVNRDEPIKDIKKREVALKDLTQDGVRAKDEVLSDARDEHNRLKQEVKPNKKKKKRLKTLISLINNTKKS